MSQVPEPHLPDGHDHVIVDEQATHGAAGIEQHERVVTDGAGLHHERTVHFAAAEHRLKLAKIAKLTWLLFGTIEVLIGLRVLFKLIGANPDNALARFIYNVTALFLAPFFGLTGSPSADGMVLEISSLIALLLYGLVGWAIVRVVLPLFDRPTTTSSSTYDRYRS